MEGDNSCKINTGMDNKDLILKSKWVRRKALEMIVSAKKGHIGGAFSCADILVALFYGGILNYNPKQPDWEERDRFILSKGHSCTALYAILADLGFFPIDELGVYCQRGSMLGGHPDINIPGVEADTGSLGHGLGIGAGLALAAKLDNKNYKTVVLLGDGECYEGSVWEAAMFAAHHKLNNLFAIIDRNRQCVNDYTEDCNTMEPFEDKWKSFNWDTKIINGHSFTEIIDIFKDFRTRTSTRPLVVIANTVKGKGVSFMEGEIKWHHTVPSDEDLKKAREELSIDV